MNIRNLLAAAVLSILAAGAASAQTLKLEFVAGGVNLVAQNVPARLILAEWARLGGTRIVNGDRVAGPPITVELTAVPERQALDIVLRGVAGYMMTAGGTGASRIDRVMILPTSTAPRSTPATAAFAPPPAPVVNDDAQDAADDPTEAPVRRPATPVRIIGVPGVNGTPAVTVVGTPGAPAQPFAPAPQPASTTPALPGPASAPRPNNPFTALPGTSRPGEITPAPPQPPDGNRPVNTPNAPDR